MRSPVILLRFAVLAAAAQFATACTTMSTMNPFDGDPNGPPPAPHMLAGAYGGDEDGGSYSSEPRRASAGDEAQPRRVADNRSSYDRSYGTNSVESSELPPPSADEAASEPAPSDDPIPRASTTRGPGDEGTRTLSTTRSAEVRSASPAPKAASTHKVAKGEELADIADAYGVREVDIIALNSLRPPYALKPGQEIQIPARETASDDAPVPKAKPDDGAPREKPSKQASGENGRFDWPVSGKVISGFGAAGDGLYNEGINIAVPVGTPVKASAPGTVRYAGNELKGYGNLVLIEHAGGFVTAYAHNDQLKVKRGDKIARGDVIALSGKTGNVKTPQLHFEIRKGTESVDPRKYLVSNDS